MEILTTAQAYAKVVDIENFFRTKMAMCILPMESYSLPNQDYVPVKFQLASVMGVPSVMMQAKAAQDVLAVQEQMLGWAGHEGRDVARKSRAQEHMQAQELEIQEEKRHLQELSLSSPTNMRR